MNVNKYREHNDSFVVFKSKTKFELKERLLLVSLKKRLTQIHSKMKVFKFMIASYILFEASEGAEHLKNVFYHNIPRILSDKENTNEEEQHPIVKLTVNGNTLTVEINANHVIDVQIVLRLLQWFLWQEAVMYISSWELLQMQTLTFERNWPKNEVTMYIESDCIYLKEMNMYLYGYVMVRMIKAINAEFEVAGLLPNNDISCIIGEYYLREDINNQFGDYYNIFKDKLYSYLDFKRLNSNREIAYTEEHMQLFCNSTNTLKFSKNKYARILWDRNSKYAAHASKYRNVQQPIQQR